MIQSKPVNKLNIKECQSALRKLKREISESNEQIGFIEDYIYLRERIVKDIKERIKKLASKK